MYKYNTLLQTRESRYQSSATQASDVTQTNQSLPPDKQDTIIAWKKMNDTFTSGKR